MSISPRIGVLAGVIFSVLCQAAIGHCGAGTANFAVFDPRPVDTVATSTAHAVGARYFAATLSQMNQYEVWGIELLTREAVTSASIQSLGTPFPVWNGNYSTGWVELLNTNELISYCALGRVKLHKDRGAPREVLEVDYEIMDLATNKRVVTVRCVADDIEVIGESLARQTIAALQLYLAEITGLRGTTVTLSIGLESVSTGTLLGAYAHGHGGPHPPGYPAHGHRDEDDHLLGSKVYARFRNSAPRPAHSHSYALSPVRAALHTHTSGSLVAAAATTETQPVVDDGLTSAMPQYLGDAGLTSTTQIERCVFAAHLFDGRRTGILRVEGFLKPHDYYNQYFAVARIVEGFAVPGGFVRLYEGPDKQ